MRKKNISNWGNFPQIEAEVATPAYEEDIRDRLLSAPTVLARGNGRCYGDAALNEHLLSTARLNKLLYLDEQAAIVECQAGVLLSELLEVIVPRGLFLPVTPGTKFVSVGGAVAADIHGKNHHKEGSFSRHLIHFELMDAQGKIHLCSRQSEPELFWNTIGGMGLTGIILSARFRLKKIETSYIRKEILTAANLAEAMQLFEASEDWTYTVAWIDCLQKGRNMGRSILFRGEHALLEELPARQKDRPLSLAPSKSIQMPFHLPGFALNRWSVKAFNFLFYHRHRLAARSQLVSYEPFFYPLDAILHWNRMYGRKGFTQYQLVLPKAASEEGLLEILECIRRAGAGSFLSVLKLFGLGEAQAPHSFPIEGYTLALDFKISPALPALIAQLDQILLRLGGKVYLAKDAFSDARLSGVDFQGMDPKFQSVQRRRILATNPLATNNQPS
ncbi:MAG: FAD-binding oxidoreductase [Bacteroidota bacterium]